jgi:hypothetical protein
MKKIFLMFVFLVSSFPVNVQAEEFGGVEFPGGNASFADAVVSFTPGIYGASNPNLGASKALGAPNYTESDTFVGDTFVSLGQGGAIVLQFVA